MDYFPAFIKVKDKAVLVIGGTEDALHKVRLLRKSTARIIIFGLIEDETLQKWIDGGIIDHEARPAQDHDLSDAAFAYIGTHNHPERDAAITLFDRFALPYSVIDNKARSSFITPALIDRAPVVVAIGTEGAAPIIARDIKSRIEAELSPLTGAIAKVAGAFRARVEHLPHGAPRRKFWQRYLDEVVPEAAKAASDDPEKHLERGLEHLLAEVECEDRPQSLSKPIRIVNTSAGDPDLLTRQALSFLHDADLVLYHHHTPQAILELTRREASKLMWDRNGLTADETARIIRAATQGRSVVVMAGNDDLPFDESLLVEAGLSIDHVAYVRPNEPEDDYKSISHLRPSLVRSVNTMRTAS